MDMRPEILRSANFLAIKDRTVRRHEPPPAEAARRYDLKRAIRHIRRRLAIVVVSIGVGSLLALAVGFLLKPSFTATALLAVNEPQDDGTGRAGDVSVDTQIAMLQSPVFLERAFANLSHVARLSSSVPQVQDLERRLKVIQVMRSRLIAVNFSAKSPADAAAIANRIARLYVEDPVLQSVASIDDASETLSAQIASLEDALQRAKNKEAEAEAAGSSKTAASNEVSELRDQIASLKLSQSLARRRLESRQQMLALSPPVQLVALANPPVRSSSVSRRLIVVPAILFSTIFGVAFALAVGSLDKRVYLPSDLIENFAVPYAGAVPRRRRSAIQALVRASACDVGYLRALDAVVTETLLLQRAQKRTILVTTSDDCNDTSEFALNFASAAARMRRRTLLVDIDTTRSPRRGSDSSQLPDVFDVLAGRCPPGAAIQKVSATDLDCLRNRNDSDADLLALIASERLGQLITELGLSYDWVILKGPPVVGVSETRLIAAKVDATILIVRSGKSRFPEVKSAIETLSSSMSPGAAGETSSQIVTVLTDAPRQSLPATFRDKRAAGRSVALSLSVASTTQSISSHPAEGAEDVDKRADKDKRISRLASTRGSAA
jgi:succinoglycan biosynthesis transport protein ExoP